MRKLLWILAILLSPAASHAACTALTPGMNAAQIQTAVNACATAGGGTVNVPAGSYPVTANINLPCGVNLAGPILPYQKTHYQTAVWTGSSSFAGQPIRTAVGCSTLQSIEYIEWDGQHPTNGGGFIYVTAGTTNLSIDHDFIHGSNANAYAEVLTEAGVGFDGTTAGAVTQNVTVTLNEFGPESLVDCGYPGGAMGETDTEGGGGFCGGVIIGAQTKNVSVTNNVFQNMEQGGKILEASSGHGNSQLFTLEKNSFTGISRIDFETQSNIYDTSKPTFQNVRWNYLGDRAPNGQFNFDLSIANGCGNPPATPNCTAHMDYNVDIQTNATNARGGGNEFWGDSASTGNSNWFEGFVARAIGGAITWSQSGQMQFNNNTFNITSGSNTSCTAATSGYWSPETGNHPSANPTCTGNTFSNVGTGTITSQAPTISPSGGTFTGSQTVTLACPGCTNRDLNTSIWYTTDGSTPVAGTSKLYTAPFSISATTTVKAVGMWGAINQPYSYPAGYGYVPSSTISATFTAAASGFFISPTGNDANPGTLASPWLTPNHAMTCGQTITAVSGTYSAANFGAGKWGAVSCPAANNVAWLQCQTFDTCKISTTSTDAMRVDASFWGVQGWETSTAAPNQSGGCFTATARTSSTTVHHIIFANNVANGCQGGGFTSYNNGTAGVDYLTIVGNIAYNAARGSTQCFSGISIYTPVASDSVAGTHDYVAGNISYDNLEPNPCAGGTPSDGEGVIVDTMDGSQGGPQYNQQVAVENNVVFNNGGMGLEVINNQLQSTPAHVFFRGNTAVGDATDLNQTGGCLGRSDVSIKLTKNTSLVNNLAQTRAGTSCGSGAIYGSFAETVDSSSTASNNWFYSALGHSTFVDNGGSFAYASTTSTNPALASVTDPGAPSCTGKASAPACVATLISNLKPSAAGSSTFGYQTPSNTPITDPLYPSWLCGVTLPSGLVTPGCGASGPAATPVLTPGTESFFTSVSVSLSTSTPSATIYYTTNGTTPTASSPVYTAPIVVTSTTTIQAMAAAFGFSNSSIASATYTLSIPALTSCNQQNTGSVNSVAVGGAIQQFAQCVYSASGETLTCSPTADKYGDVATAWGADSGNITVGAIGNAPGCGAGLDGPGCVTGITAGTANSTATVGSHACNVWGWTVTNSPPTLLSATVTLQGGGTAVNVGSTVQACANMFYTGSISTQLCGTGTDAYGTAVSNWTSSAPSKATVVPATGVYTGVAAGTTNAGVTAGSFTPSLAVTVNTPITGVNVQFGGAQISGAQIQ